MSSGAGPAASATVMAHTSNQVHTINAATGVPSGLTSIPATGRPDIAELEADVRAPCPNGLSRGALV